MNSVQSFIQPQVLAQIGFAGVVVLTLSGALIAVFPRNIFSTMSWALLSPSPGWQEFSSTWGALLSL
jgi:hypothetical protein